MEAASQFVLRARSAVLSQCDTFYNHCCWLDATSATNFVFSCFDELGSENTKTKKESPTDALRALICHFRSQRYVRFAVVVEDLDHTNAGADEICKALGAALDDRVCVEREHYIVSSHWPEKLAKDAVASVDVGKTSIILCAFG